MPPMPCRVRLGVLPFASLRRTVFLAFVCLGTIFGTHLVHAQEVPITTIAELQKRPRKDLEKEPTVRVRGVVSVLGEGLFSSCSGATKERYFYMEDGDSAIWVSIREAEQRDLWKGTDEDIAVLQEGSEIEVEGVMSAGLFSPRILPVQISLIGTKPLQTPANVSVRDLMNGAIWARRVTASGVIQDISDAKEESKRVIRVETGIGFFAVWLPKTGDFEPARLLDAEVQVTGAVTALTNGRGEFLRPRLMISRVEDLVVKTPPPVNPFNAKKLPINQLDSYEPGGRPRHRRRISGTVTYLTDEYLIVQEGAYAVRVRPITEDSGWQAVHLGDLIEASGFIDRTRPLADLGGACVRRLKSGVMPEAIPVTFKAIQDGYANWAKGEPTFPGFYEGRLCEITGRLLSLQSSLDGLQRLELDCGDSISTAFLKGPPVSFRIGSRLRVVGIAAMQYRQTAQSVEPTRLDVWLHNQYDIEVLKTPSWWTPENSALAAGGLLAVSLIASAWAITLRRTVRKRSLQLAQEVQHRRDAAIEFEATLRERTRLAANLHDTVLQTVTGLGLQIKSCEMKATNSEGSELVGPLGIAWKMAQRSQEDLRNSVWALKALPIKESNIKEAILSVTKQIAHGHNVVVEVEAEETLPPVADFVAGDLLLIVQEAVHNAIKHAMPTEIRVSVFAEDSGRRLKVNIRDNGKGFAIGTQPDVASGHFGLQGMRERTQRLDGTFQIESQLENGTCIRIEVPLHPLDHQLA